MRRQPGEPAERHVEDVLGLQLGERVRSGLERLARRGAVLRGADRGDDGVDHVEGAEPALDDVGAVPGLLQPELRAAADDHDLVGDVGAQQVGQVERAGDAVDQRHHVHREVRLQLRVLVEVVQHHVGVGVAPQLDHQAGVGAGGLVVDVGDALDLAAVGQLADAARDRRRRGLVGQRGDHDLLAAAGQLLDLGVGPHPDRPAAGPVGLEDRRPGPGSAPPVGKSGPFTKRMRSSGVASGCRAARRPRR